MELIDREELLRKLDKMIEFERRQVLLTHAWNTLLCAKEAVLECKVVDAEPVKHGKWNKRTTIAYCRNGIFIDYDEYLCSECQRVTEIKENYCSNCGAKMDLEGEQVETHQVV